MKANDIRLLVMSLLLCCLPISVNAQQADSSIFSKPLNLDASVKTERVARSEQKGDTLVFNAAAYQVADNADSERLISKMPGISVSESGVEANGKDVARILLDGQEFFGNDPLTALRNIPAELVKQIEVINKLSDAAQMTGVDDGEGYTAINIVTKRKKGAGLTTGRIYGSYGLSDDADHRHNYIAGGNLNHFTDKRTISIIGMSNNISKFNFTSSDILSGSTGLDAGGGNSFKVKEISGLSNVHSIGVNYTSKVCNFTYFFNDIGNYNHGITDRTTLASNQKYPDRLLLTHTWNDYNAHNMTHKVNGKITLNPSRKHSIVIRPNATFEDMYNRKNQYGHYRYDITGVEKFVRKQNNQTDNDRWAIRAGIEASYRYRFAKSRRSLSAYGRYSLYRYSAFDRSWEYRWNKTDADTTDLSTTNYSFIQNRDRLTLQHNVTGKLTFSEPINKRSIISGEYTFYMVNNRGKSLAYPFADGAYASEPRTRTSAVNTSIFYHNRAGIRYNYGYKKLSVTAIATYQHVLYDGTATLPAEAATRRHYHHPLYKLVANLPFNSSNRLRIEAEGKTRNPSNSMLQDIVDRSNTSYLRAGNPDINPAYLHTADVQYVNTNKKAGTTFSLSISYTGSNNYFCDSLVINNNTERLEFTSNGEAISLKEGDQFTKPVNLGGYHKMTFKSSFAMPIDLIRCNFNIGLQASLQRLPGMINGEYVPINRNWIQLSGRLDSNISKNIDFTVGYMARYSVNDYSGKFGTISNNYFFHKVNAQLKWIFLKNFTFTGAFIYKNFTNTEGLYNDNIYLCDLFIGHRFLKTRKLEVSVGVNDLFDNNSHTYWHSVSSSGRSDGTNLGIGRYFSIQCIWHFRAGTKPKKIIR